MPTRTATSLPYTELEVAIGNFDTSRAPIDRVIIHTMDGTWQGAAARFDDPASQVSAHYGVKLDGSLIHWLEEFNTAYHAGDYAMNQRSIGIEHEDGGDYNGVRPDVLYTESAKLVRDICLFYNIPIDRQHILKHSEVSDAPTGCPDALDIDRIVREASGATDTGTIYKGLDLTNQDSMKIAVDVWDAVVNQHEYVTVTQYNTDLKAKEDTINGLNSTIGNDSQTIKTQQATIDSIPTQLKVLQDQIDVLKPQADKVPDLTKQFEQAIEDRKSALDENKVLTNSNAQLKNTSYTTAATNALIGELLKRVFNRATFKS